MTAIIETKGLTKSYGRGAGVFDLELAVPAGAVCALLGDNGAGKSTTIKMLTGLLPADDGTANILDKDCWRDAVELRHRVGYVPEKPRFYDWMSVDEIGWFTAGFHKPGFLGRFHEWTSKFRVRNDAKLKVLSKGEYAKVALALALAHDPEVLILDEPTSGLDLRVRREFLESMVVLAAEGRTVLISSHQISEVERVASHVVFLSAGKLVLSSTAEELKRRFVRLRLRHDGTAPNESQLGTILERNGTGPIWSAIVRDPKPDAIAALQAADHIHDFEATTLTLEETYTALAGRREEVSP